MPFSNPWMWKVWEGGGNSHTLPPLPLTHTQINIPYELLYEWTWCRSMSTTYFCNTWMWKVWEGGGEFSYSSPPSPPTHRQTNTPYELLYEWTWCTRHLELTFANGFRSDGSSRRSGLAGIVAWLKSMSKAWTRSRLMSVVSSFDWRGCSFDWLVSVPGRRSATQG